MLVPCGQGLKARDQSFEIDSAPRQVLSGKIVARRSRLEQEDTVLSW